MSMKSLLLILIIFIFSNTLYAQEKEKKEKLKIDIHGFVKTDYWVDTRQVVYAREGLFTLFPKDISLDKNGRDINAEPSFNFSAITSRLNFKIKQFKAFGADAYGFIEADFSGMSNITINTFRLRHAYINLDWGKSELLLGQYWHPLFVTKVFPTVISLNTGAPFQPFNRSPQIRFTRHIGNWNIIAAVISQRDYANIGPKGRNPEYMENSLVPNGHLQLQYAGEKNTFGFAADYKVIRPQLVTDSNVVSDERLGSYAFMAYYKWINKKFEYKMKAIYGQNLSEQLMMGGYAVVKTNPLNGVQEYTPTNHFFLWGDLIYRKKLKNITLIPGLFAGFTKNLGTTKDASGTFYAVGSKIDQMYRIAPSISVKSGNTMFSLEWEYSHVMYGDRQLDGTVANTHAVASNRILMTGFYFF
ncbi:MAG: hypothetical protein DSY76_05020 [Bacteroidetes bacterium]|nr:MAG: hypothetical protein DSY76_05020 [Bacteroidota bacterium]